MEIKTKREFFKLWKEGALGNRTLLSEDLREAMSWPTDKIGFREQGAAGGGAWELVDKPDAPQTYQRWISLGRKFTMDGSVPNDKTTMQGELCRTYKGIESFLCVRDEIEDRYEYSGTNGCEYYFERVLKDPGLPPMRRTMANGWHRHRGYLETRVLLERYMDPSSRDDLDTLLDMYPDASIEFSCFSINTGVFPRKNTIFWEIRNY